MAIDGLVWLVVSWVAIADARDMARAGHTERDQVVCCGDDAALGVHDVYFHHRQVLAVRR